MYIWELFKLINDLKRSQLQRSHQKLPKKDKDCYSGAVHK